MSKIIDLPVKDIYYTHDGDVINGVGAEIDGVSCYFDRDSKDKRYITQLCIAWLALEDPKVLTFDKEEK